MKNMSKPTATTTTTTTLPKYIAILMQYYFHGNRTPRFNAAYTRSVLP